MAKQRTDEPFDAPVQAMLTGSARAVLRHEARQRGLTPSALLRMIVTQWLAANVADEDLQASVEADVGRAARGSRPTNGGPARR